MGAQRGSLGSRCRLLVTEEARGHLKDPLLQQAVLAQFALTPLAAALPLLLLLLLLLFPVQWRKTEAGAPRAAQQPVLGRVS